MLTTLCTQFDEFGNTKKETKLAKIKKDTSLRKAILQAAITGQLVSNVEGETETGKQLLDRIIEERNKKLLAEWEENLKKNPKAKKPAPVVASEIDEDEIPFEIPESWCWCRLGEIIQISSGDGLTSSQMELGNIPVYGGNGITGYHNNSNVHKETIVIGRVGFYCGSVHITSKEAWVTDNAFITSYPEKQIDRMFLVYILRHLNLGQDNNATAQPVVSGKKIYPILFPLPPLSVQNAIVTKLEEVLPFVDAYENAVVEKEELKSTLLDKVKKAILQEAIQGKLTESWRKEMLKQVQHDGRTEETGNQLLDRIIAERNAKALAEWEEKLKTNPKAKKPTLIVASEIDEDEIPFEIPDSWCWCRWGELSDSIQYGYNAPAKETGKIKMVRITDIQNGKVNWETVPYCEISEEEISIYKLRKYDILFARTGGTVGKSFLVDEEPEDAVYAGYLIRTQYDSEKLSPKYMKMFMESQLYWEQLKNGTIATAQPNCNGQTLSKMILPLPPLEEQEKIVKILEQMLPLCEKLES